jgi:hypothetical protein
MPFKYFLCIAVDGATQYMLILNMTGRIFTQCNFKDDNYPQSLRKSSQRFNPQGTAGKALLKSTAFEFIHLQKGAYAVICARALPSPDTAHHC